MGKKYICNQCKRTNWHHYTITHKEEKEEKEEKEGERGWKRKKKREELNTYTNNESR